MTKTLSEAVVLKPAFVHDYLRMMSSLQVSTPITQIFALALTIDK
jgi:hypothetical protein